MCVHVSVYMRECVHECVCLCACECVHVYTVVCMHSSLVCKVRSVDCVAQRYSRMHICVVTYCPLIVTGRVSPEPSTYHSTLLRVTFSGFMKEAVTDSVLPTRTGSISLSAMEGVLKRNVSLSTKTVSVSFTDRKALMLTMSWSCTFPMYSTGDREMGTSAVAARDIKWYAYKSIISRVNSGLHNGCRQRH